MLLKSHSICQMIIIIFRYAVVGDEKGIIRFFDHDLKLLRWTKNFFLPAVHCIHFNLTDDIPAFKKILRMIFLLKISSHVLFQTC